MTSSTKREIVLPHNWEPRTYQRNLWGFLENGGLRAAAVWHRRAGKDLTMINWVQRCIPLRVGLYWHLFPTYNQGRKIAWEGMTRDGRKFLDHFHPSLVAGTNSTDMRVSFKNGSIYQVVGSDNPDRLVGSNPVGVILSEYALQDPRAWDYIRPILVENGGWAVFIYTPRGRNHGYNMVVMASKNPKWFSEVLSVRESKVVTEEAIQEERDAGMPEEMIQQEFYCSFDAALVGSYYGEHMAHALKTNRIRTVPYDSMLDVHTSWDLGIGDCVVIIFFQLCGDEIRIIDCYSNRDKGLQHYAKILRQDHRAEYNYDNHFGPHDLAVRSLNDGKSRIEAGRELGIIFKVIPRASIEDGIDLVRSIMSRIWWNDDTPDCRALIDAMNQYHKEWDPKKKCFADRPYHDWSSDFADSMRTLAAGVHRFASRHTLNRPKVHPVILDDDPFEALY